MRRVHALHTLNALVAVVLAAAALTASPAGAAGGASGTAILNAGVISPADVPTTWQSAPAKDAGTKQFTNVAACKQIAPALSAARRNPRKLSPEFSDPATNGNTLVDDVVYAFKNTAGAGAYLAALKSRSAASCFQRALQHELGRAGEVAPFRPVTSLQGAGDDNVDYEGVIQVPGQGGIIADFVGVRVGRAALLFSFLNPGAPLPQAPPIVDAVVNRVARAGA